VPRPSNAPFDSGFRPFDLTSDGRRVIASQEDEPPEENKVNLHLTMIQNWFEDLRRRLPLSER
jgi:hypothetical protein